MTVSQLSSMIINNSAWPISIKWIRIILSGDNLTLFIHKKAYFLFVINLITRTKGYYRNGMRLKVCGTLHYVEPNLMHTIVLVTDNSPTYHIGRVNKQFVFKSPYLCDT